MHEQILILGAGGQIGTELCIALRQLYGHEKVITADIRDAEHPALLEGTHLILDVLDRPALTQAIQKHHITQVYHLAAILSAKGEQHPIKAWHINMDGLIYVLEACLEGGVKKLFWPSSIAVFGPNTPKIHTPQETITQPVSMYGISKQAGELWCQYYHLKRQLDVRSLRYPGIISYASQPGGGTTDYAVEIYFEAIRNRRYTCFLKPDATLPMIYMPDAIRATLELMEAPADQIKVRTSYNLAGMSFSPSEVALSIRNHFPDFEIGYAPDYRQQIAESWPASMDDGAARTDWGWKPKYDLDAMTRDMLLHLSKAEESGAFMAK